MAMTVAEQIEQRGKKEGKKETAANLLKLGIDLKIISQATGLSEEEIRQLVIH